MLREVEALVRRLFAPPARDPDVSRVAQRLDLGAPTATVYCDLGLDDRVYVVTLEEVPRWQWRPDTPTGPLEVVTVDALVHVTLVGDGVDRATVRVTDDVGTSYSSVSGRSDTDGRDVRSFGPRPPAPARTLRVELLEDDHVVLTVDVPVHR
ncbi:hypothetical protein [Nocardioides flavescens]|uniref:Uncharacterized protein n=1 Tax=Nocardioides flavescens TaxID=2691959 RepID=A0A6L7F208_9ACTN|nr:hypothetical protein [Nocardioides flavescens]MXG89194.1 hypothetical protein [Nocardioides flavescens]